MGELFYLLQEPVSLSVRGDINPYLIQWLSGGNETTCKGFKSVWTTQQALAAEIEDHGCRGGRHWEGKKEAKFSCHITDLMI